jgi:hypothetical protein
MGKILRWAELWTERRPVPLALSDSEILDWLSEYCEKAVYNLPTRIHSGGFTLTCDGVETKATTLRGAVCLAAAKHKEAN